MAMRAKHFKLLYLILVLNTLYTAVCRGEYGTQLPSYNKEEYDRICYKSPIRDVFKYIFGSEYPFTYDRTLINGDFDTRDDDSVGEKEKVDEQKHLDLTPYPDDMSDEDFNNLMKEILFNFHPTHGTTYNSEWGHVCLTEDGQPPITGKAIHFDIFDGFLPPGLVFNDLKVLLLYTVYGDYYLYKIKFGDMVVTLRPDVTDASVQLFENYGSLMVVRVCFFMNGLLERHEYVETSYRSKVFQKMSGKSVTPQLPKFDPNTKVTSEYIIDWFKERYKDINKTKPPIVEEVIDYNVVFTE